MKEILLAQYDMVRGSRAVLFDYCDTISAEHFVYAHPGFGRGGSIRSLLIHICNCYEGWITKRVMRRPFEGAGLQSLNSVNEVRTWAHKVDDIVREFIDVFDGRYQQNLTIPFFGDDNITTTPLHLFTHVITHEYHHKGQILSISRQLGYVPVDTDVLR